MQPNRCDLDHQIEKLSQQVLAFVGVPDSHLFKVRTRYNNGIELFKADSKKPQRYWLAVHFKSTEIEVCSVLKAWTSFPVKMCHEKWTYDGKPLSRCSTVYDFQPNPLKILWIKDHYELDKLPLSKEISFDNSFEPK